MKKPKKKKVQARQGRSRPPSQDSRITPEPRTLKSNFLRVVEIAAAAVGLIASAYLGFELFYQTASPDIEVSSSESASPFSLPFSVKTQSIIFDMYRASFTCGFEMTDVNRNTYRVGSEAFGGGLQIDRKNPGNYFCRNQVPAEIVASLTIRISPKYCTNIFGLYCWPREPGPSIFTWVKTEKSGYWIKGKIGN